MYDFFIHAGFSQSCVRRGSWVVASLLASEMADEFYCGALMQPSLNLEEQRYGGSTADLISRINRPVLLMPIMVSPMFVRVN